MNIIIINVTKFTKKCFRFLVILSHIVTTSFQPKKYMLSTQGTYMFFCLILGEKAECP